MSRYGSRGVSDLQDGVARLVVPVSLAEWRCRCAGHVLQHMLAKWLRCDVAVTCNQVTVTSYSSPSFLSLPGRSVKATWSLCHQLSLPETPRLCAVQVASCTGNTSVACKGRDASQHSESVWRCLVAATDTLEAQEWGRRAQIIFDTIEIGLEPRCGLLFGNITQAQTRRQGRERSRTDVSTGLVVESRSRSVLGPRF